MKRNGKYIFAIVVFFALILRLTMVETIKGYGGGDLQCYERWATSAASDFLHVYRNTDVDYPPLYLYVLFLLGKVMSLVGNLPVMNVLLLKLPAIIADILTGLFIYKIASKRFNGAISLIISSVYLFNPAIFINSAMWGQTDSILTLIVVLALYYLLADKMIPSAVFFAMACMMKPQGFIFLPILLLELVKKNDLKKLMLSAAAGLATVLVIILPFTIGEDPLWIVRLFLQDLHKYPYADVHAFNLFFIMGGDLVTDDKIFLFLPFKTWSLIFTVCVFALAGFMYLKSKSTLRIFFMTLILQACVFMFTGRMHERYLYPAILIMIIVYLQCKDVRLISIFLWMSTLVFINQMMVLYCSAYLDEIKSWIAYFNAAGSVFSLLGIWQVIRLIIVGRDVLLRNETAGEGSLLPQNQATTE